MREESKQPAAGAGWRTALTSRRESDGQPQAFLPSRDRDRVSRPCGAIGVQHRKVARVFLKALGLTEPDPVDDVVRNVLPKYRQGRRSRSSDADYEADIERILNAFGTDSKAQREQADRRASREAAS